MQPQYPAICRSSATVTWTSLGYGRTSRRGARRSAPSPSRAICWTATSSSSSRKASPSSTRSSRSPTRRSSSGSAHTSRPDGSIAGVAALWVECDCNIPSGESLLRQMLFAHRYCTARFGKAPDIAWLPDLSVLPTRCRNCSRTRAFRYFATTKLLWNDTTRFPYPQFVWEGPDGAASFGADYIVRWTGPRWRVARATERRRTARCGIWRRRRRRHIENFGRSAPARHTGSHPRDWFERLNDRRAQLPVHEDELYLEFHRGIYTTHHDVKFHNALLERASAKPKSARVVRCRARPAGRLANVSARLDRRGTIVLRNQFHDVLPGTSIAAVYEDAAAEYAPPANWSHPCIASTTTILPRAPRRNAHGAVVPALPRSAIVSTTGSCAPRC